MCLAARGFVKTCKIFFRTSGADPLVLERPAPFENRESCRPRPPGHGLPPSICIGDRVRPNPDRARPSPNRERLHLHGYGNLFKPRGSQGPEGPPVPPRARRRAKRAWRAKRAPSRRPPPEPRAARAGDEIRNEKIRKRYDTAQAKLGRGLAVFGEAGSRLIMG